MSIIEKIRTDLTSAMKAKDTLRLSVLRGILTMFMQELTATKRTPQDVLTDDEAFAVLRRAHKQRGEAAAQFIAGNRPDLAKNEESEAAIITEYLPQLMSREEIHPLALAKRDQLQIVDKAKAGMLTGALMKELHGKADGADVKAVVDALF